MNRDSDDEGFETCASCTHFVELDKGHGSCYRYPPVPLPITVTQSARVVVPDGEPQDALGGNVALGAMYPPVNRDTLSCGEHETTEEADADQEYHDANPE